MRYDDQPWEWIATIDPLSAVLLALQFMIGFSVGAALASLATWLEGHLGAQPGTTWLSH